MHIAVGGVGHVGRVVALEGEFAVFSLGQQVGDIFPGAVGSGVRGVGTDWDGGRRCESGFVQRFLNLSFVRYCTIFLLWLISKFSFSMQRQMNLLLKV